MQQTFPASTAQRIVISDIRGDLFVYGWEQQTIQVTTDGRIDQLQPEDDILTIRNCNDNIELKVPLETAIEAKNINGGVVIENVHQVEVDGIGGDVSIKTISGDVAITKIAGDAALTSVGDELELTDISGGLTIKQASSVHIRGRISDDASFEEVARIDIERVDGDLVLIDTDEVIVKRVRGDLYGKSGIATLHAGMVDGDCQVQGDGNAEVLLESVGGDLAISGASRFEVGNVGSDCLVQGSANGEGKISNVGSDLKILGAARLQIGNVGSDCELRDVQGEVSLSQVGSDATLFGIAGNLRVGNIGSDAHLRGMGRSVSIGNIGSDLYLQGTFPIDSEVHASVGGDARIVLPENANLTIRARAGGNVKGHSIVSNFAGNSVNLVYGEGVARLELNVGGDLELQSSESPRSSSSTSGNAGDWNSFGSDWGRFGRNWGREMSDFGREMEHMSRNLGRDITAAVSEATSSLGFDVASNIANAKEQTHRAQREAEEQHHYAEQERQRAKREAEEQRRRAEQERQRAKREGRWAGERNPYFNVRINEREWKMGPDRIDAIVEQARQAAAGGVQGALEAVEQALKNIHVNVPPMPTPPPRSATPPVPPMPPMPPGPGTPPVPSVPPTPGEASPIAPSAFSSADAPSDFASVDEDVDVKAEQIARDEADEHPLPGREVSGKVANLDQEREAILRMIAEGRISPEEGDLLLEALG